MGGWTPTKVKPSVFMPCTPSHPEFFQHHSTDEFQRGGMLSTVTKVVNIQNLYKLLRRVLHQSRHPHPQLSLHLKPHDLKMFLYQFLPNSTGRLDSAAQKWQVKALSDCLEYSELIPACAHSCGMAHTSH